MTRRRWWPRSGRTQAMDIWWWVKGSQLKPMGGEASRPSTSWPLR